MNSTVEELFGLIKRNETVNFLKQLEMYYDSIDVNQMNEYGNTMLHMACRSRNLDIVVALIDRYDASVIIQNLDGRTPLHLAVIYGMNDKAYNILKLKGGKLERIESNSEKIISKLINANQSTLMIKDKDAMDPMSYYNIYSNLDSHQSLDKNNKSYKTKSNFFDLIKKADPKGYEESLGIYFAMKKN